MIADALRADIERFAHEMQRENALFVGAAEGRLTPDVIARYLNNVRVMIGQTPYFMKRARDRALASGRLELAAYFTSKWAEEEGHDRWASADLTRLRTRFGESSLEAEVTPSLRRLMRLLDDAIERDPALYLAYILFAEYHVVLIGPRWLEVLEARCGIPSSMLTVIGKHAELDKEHAAEGLRAIDALVTDPEMLAPMREILRSSMELFQRFCAEVVAGGARVESAGCNATLPA